MRIGPAVVLALFAVPLPAAAQPAGPARAGIGEVPPSFSLQDLRGRTVTVPGPTIAAHTIVLHFWNTG